MFRNYFKTAFRSLRANKVYSTIMVAGLAVGISVCLVIFVFIRYEQSFDDFHPDGARIYRVLTVGQGTPDKPRDPESGVPAPLPGALENDLPGWKTTGVFGMEDIQMMVMDKEGRVDKMFKEKVGVMLMEPSFFSIFNFPWLAGDPAKVLAPGDNIAMTKSTAERYFGDWRQAIGRTVKFQNFKLFTVAGILADPPTNSDFRQLKIILPYGIAGFKRSNDWTSIDSDHQCFILLPANETLATASKQLDQLSRKYRAASNKARQLLQPLSEVHYDDKAGNYSGRTITRDRIQQLWMIAGFILLIACVNFVNISTAQAVNRAKEVGVRKVLGSNRRQLRLQFMLEALLLVLFSVLLAFVLTSLFLKPVGAMLDMPVTIGLLRSAPVLYFLLALMAAVTLLAGFYPALVLSGFNPISALKTRLAERSNSGINIRRVLVVVQFVIAQGLIIGTLLILRQMNYFMHTSMGFDKDALVTVPFRNDSVGLSKLDYVRDQLLHLRGVQRVSFNGSDPAEEDSWWTDFKFDHATKGCGFAVIRKFVDADYVPTYGLKLVAGRNVTTADSIREFLVNEKLVRKLGFADPREVLNKQVNLWDGYAVGSIVGVIKDFHSTSLKDSLAPLLVVNVKQRFNAAGIRLNGKDVPGTMKAIEKLWGTVYPDFVFEYHFLDDQIAHFYREEARLSLFYRVFASIAIFLSCLGLYGLASFMAVQRLKEVGIRKVLGATVANIIYLFSREFIWLIGIAFLVSAPIAWYFVHEWLEHYVFRLPISGWIFVAGGSAALVIALATVSLQAWKAASVNPVKNLRSE